jgi:hypothetical protein
VQVEHAARATPFDTVIARALEPIRTEFERSIDAMRNYLRSNAFTTRDIEREASIACEKADRYILKLSRGVHDAATRLQERLALSPDEITSISLLPAEPHGWRLPLLVECTEGMFVLKYGAVTPWDILSEPISELCAAEISAVPLSDGDCGWYMRPWVRAAGRGGGDPRAQAEALGVMLALGFFFNISDLHHENYIVTDSGALPIDLECTLSAHPNAAWGFDWRLLGFASTPVQIKAVQGESHFAKYSACRVEDEEISFREKYVSHEHLLRDEDGRPRSILLNIEELRDGYRRAVDWSVKYGADIAREYSRRDWLTRKLYRPTSVYRLILSELSLQPREAASTILRSRMQFIGHPTTFPALPIVHWESHQLRAGNIPIFHVSVSSGRVFQNYQETSLIATPPPMAVWEAKVRSASSKIANRFLERAIEAIA